MLDSRHESTHVLLGYPRAASRFRNVERGKLRCFLSDRKRLTEADPLLSRRHDELWAVFCTTGTRRSYRDESPVEVAYPLQTTIGGDRTSPRTNVRASNRWDSNEIESFAEVRQTHI